MLKIKGDGKNPNFTFRTRASATRSVNPRCFVRPLRIFNSLRFAEKHKPLTPLDFAEGGALKHAGLG